MDLRYSETDEAFRAEIRAWLQKEVPAHGPPPPPGEIGQQLELRPRERHRLATPGEFLTLEVEQPAAEPDGPLHRR